MTYDELLETLDTPEKILKTRIALLNSFEMYIKFMFLAVNQSNMTVKPFHLKVINKLESIVFQTNAKRSLALNLPVGAGKSLLVEYFISWCFARDVNNAFVYVSHSDTLINKLSNETKDIVQHEIWIILFDSVLKKSEKSKVNWGFDESINRTGLTAGVMGGSITGLDAGNPNVEGFSGALIIDDPIDASNIRHELARTDCIGFYENKLSTRRRTPTTPTILIMQRLHIEDLTGYLKEMYPDEFDFLSIPALDEDGVSFWAERFPVTELNQIRDKTPNKYYSQYQQIPTAEGGNLLKLDWFKFVDEVPAYYDYTFVTADTAYKDKQQNDFTVFIYWGVKFFNNNRKILYLIDMKRKQIKAIDVEGWIDPWLKPKIIQGYRYTWIEDKGHGIMLNQSFSIKGYHIPDEEQHKKYLMRGKDKVERANNAMPWIDKKEHNVYINNNIKDIEALRKELAGFPNVKHDDIVDCVVDGINIALTETEINYKEVEEDIDDCEDRESLGDY